VDAAAGRHQGQAEHAVVVDDEAAQEQFADFLDAERLGFRRMAARAEVLVEETLAYGRVAVVDERIVVDEGRDRQDLDVVFVQVVAGEVSGRIHHDAVAHSMSSAAAPCAPSPNDRPAAHKRPRGNTSTRHATGGSCNAAKTAARRAGRSLHRRR
jgi:hypothetical protein